MARTKQKQKRLRRGGKNTEELHIKDHNDLDNYDDVVTDSPRVRHPRV